MDSPVLLLNDAFMVRCFVSRRGSLWLGLWKSAVKTLNVMTHTPDNANSLDVPTDGRDTTFDRFPTVSLQIKPSAGIQDQETVMPSDRA